MKLSTLKNRAAKYANARGHRLHWEQVYGRADGPKSLNATCKRCGAFLALHERPDPNEIDIGGPAVAIECFTEEK